MCEWDNGALIGEKEKGRYRNIQKQTPAKKCLTLTKEIIL